MEEGLRAALPRLDALLIERAWIAPEPPGDPDAPDTGDIRPILQGYLDHHRLTLLRVCAGLSAEELRAASRLPAVASDR